MKHVDSFEDFSLNEDIILENLTSHITVLKSAITDKYVVTIYYKGEKPGVVDNGYRYLEPYALGVNESGNTVLRAWLIKGTSRTGKIDKSLVPGWRLFRMDRVSSISTTLTPFIKPRAGYNAEDTGMVEVTFAANF